MRATIVLDNGGGITLMLPGFTHFYTDPKQAAADVREWLKARTTKGWDGNEPESRCAPSWDDIRNGGFREIAFGRYRSALAVGKLIKAAAPGWANGEQMADWIAGAALA